MRFMHSSYNSDDDKTPMITPSEVIEYVYCPRFTYFMNVLRIPQFEHNRYKVRAGREIHEKRALQNRNYLRRKIDAVSKETDVYLASVDYRIRGRVDEVLELSDGTLAPLDFKYTMYRDFAFKTHTIQLAIYGLLISDCYRANVNRGYLAYIRGKKRLFEVAIDSTIKSEVHEIIDTIFAIIENEVIPSRTKNRSKCPDCCYKNICV